MVFSYWCCRQPRMLSFAEDDHKVHADPDPDMTQLRRFSVEELQTATNDFSSDNILGRGGFGKVYRGRLEDGSMVAVKRVERRPTIIGEVQFQTTNEIINMATTHRNVLRLKGFCLTQTDRLLVYPYMTNGSLSSHLRDRRESEPALNWGTRKRIALGAAKGLCYLHDECNPKIIHRDVKAANILLDEDFEAVVGDFGLAILMDYNQTHVTTDVCGTIGHIAPEYYNGLCSDKTDVYGFGIMLLELITGQKAIDLSSIAAEYDLLLLDWMKQVLKEKNTEAIADPDLQGNYVETEMEELIKIALLCTQTSQIHRPKMAQVIGMLEQGYRLGEKWEEWMETEDSNQGLKLSFQPITWYLTDSTELLSAIELSGPR